MVANFPSMIRHLQEYLQIKPLPGAEAQLAMSPLGPGDRRVSVDIPEHARVSAVLMLIYPGNEGASIPLIKRPEYPGVHSGQIAFPGGRVEPDDESLSDTALRETREEIGVNPEHITLLGQLTRIYIPPSNYVVYPFAGYIDHRPEFKPEPAEVSRILEIELSDLIDEQRVKRKSIPLATGTSVHAPYFDLAGETVWGATSMMLNELKTILKALSNVH